MECKRKNFFVYAALMSELAETPARPIRPLARRTRQSFARDVDSPHG